jgi:hypothetical protein
MSDANPAPHTELAKRRPCQASHMSDVVQPQLDACHMIAWYALFNLLSRDVMLDPVPDRSRKKRPRDPNKLGHYHLIASDG